MERIRIAPAEEKDIEQAEKISSLITPEASSSLMLAWTVEDIQKGIRNGNAMLAFHGDDVVGHINLTLWERYVEASGLIISPRQRRNGLGKRLLSGIVELALKKYPEKELIALPNHISFKIATKLGFIEFPKSYFNKEIWEGCEKCQEQHFFPKCHCRPLVWKKRKN